MKSIRAGAVVSLLAVVPGLLGASSVAFADVEDFEFEIFSARYELSADSAGRAQLDVRETLVPVFPDYDQNRGLVRYLPNWYGRTPLKPRVHSLTDEFGAPRPLDVSVESDWTVVDSVVPEGQFLYGRQVYVLDYSMSDVIKDFADSTGYQEFYWDINGVGWRQSFGEVSAEVVIPPSLAGRLVADQTSCYWGGQGATNQCAVEIRSDQGGVIVSIRQENLSASQTVTIAVAFEQGTFVVPERNPEGFWGTWLMGLLVVVLVLVLLPYSLVYRIRQLRDFDLNRAIIPEYVPPTGLSLGEAGVLLKRPDRVPTATLLALAVAGQIQIREFRRGKWEVTRTSQPIDDDSMSVLRAVLGRPIEQGESVRIKRANEKARRSFATLRTGWTTSVHQDYTTAPIPDRRGRLTLAIILGSLLVIALGVYSYFERYEHPLTPVVMLIAGLSGVLGTSALSKKPLNEEGSVMRAHLKGLKMYMELAEKDRLDYLQSPTGALRVGDAEYLKLHERLLPWAVLLGLGRAWMKELAQYYEESSPTWIQSRYRSDFSRGFGSLSQAMASSLSSSSSGGTGGGGSAGGGGGGGGGGGR